jgi:succinate dehydrogenase/fumarate reductase flavoprotein subunit
MGDEDILCAAIRCVAGELAERAFRLAHAGEDFPFNDDLRAGRDLQIGGAAARKPVWFSK